MGRGYLWRNLAVGNNKGSYPTFGENVKMMSGSKILGNCEIGSNVIIAANTYVKDCNISYICFGSSPNLIIKNKEENYFTGA